MKRNELRRTIFSSKICTYLLLCVLLFSMFPTSVGAFVIKPSSPIFGPDVYSYVVTTDKIFVFSKEDYGIKMTCLDLNTLKPQWFTYKNKLLSGDVERFTTRLQYWYIDNLLIIKNYLYYIYYEYTEYKEMNDDRTYWSYNIHIQLKCLDTDTGKEISSFDDFNYEFIYDYRKNEYLHKGDLYVVEDDNKSGRSIYLYNIKTNQVLWKYYFHSALNIYTCTLEDDYIIINSFLREVVCLDFFTGKTLWSQHCYVLHQDLYSKNNICYEFSDDCGLSQLTCIDIPTGKIIWQRKHFYEYLWLIGEKDGKLVVSCEKADYREYLHQSRYIITIDAKTGKELNRYLISNRYLHGMELIDNDVVYFEKKGFYYLKKNIFDIKTNKLKQTLIYTLDSRFDDLEIFDNIAYGIKDGVLYLLKVQ